MPSWRRMPFSTRIANCKEEANVRSPEVVAQLAGHARNLQDKALIWSLWERGGGVGELLSLHVGDAEPTS